MRSAPLEELKAPKFSLPRSEALAQIFDDMRSGIEDLSRTTFVDDRKRAISMALDAASSGDCVLIAGKGHETFQEFDGTVIPFDDRAEARELVQLKSFVREASE